MTGPDLYEAFAQIPNATDTQDPDLALSLSDELADPDDSPSQAPPYPLGRTPAIDFVQRRMIPNTSGGPLMLYGEQSLQQWCEKCLRTRRGDNTACHPDFGVDQLIWDLIDGGVLDDSAVAQYEAIVKRALPFHPAIAAVTGFSIDYSPDSDFATTLIQIDLAAAGEDPLDLTLTLDAGRTDG